MRLKSNFGPKRGWYIRRQFRYSYGQYIQNRLVTEWLCPVSGKWSPMFANTYPRTKGSATKEAFLYAATHMSDPVEISVVCRRVPASIRAKMTR